MSAPLRGGIRSLAAISKAVVQQRATIISGPPKYKVSFTEKMGLGLIMVTTVCTPAAYIMANLDYYRGAKPVC